jgi:DNA-binding SARP family transcriptional activator
VGIPGDADRLRQRRKGGYAESLLVSLPGSLYYCGLGRPPESSFREEGPGRRLDIVSKLSIYLLGPPRIECDGVEHPLERRKAFALLAYLAATAEPHSRDQLAELLFPRHTRSRSLSCLRQTLSVLRAAVGKDRLRTDRKAISLPKQSGLWVDLQEFQTLVQEIRRTDGPEHRRTIESALDRAGQLCRGEFLSGFYLRDSPGFDDWQAGEQDRLRAECSFVLERLTTMYSARGDLAAAIAHARTWLSLDPLEEAVHRCLMQLYSAAGRRAAALKQYRLCKALVRKELDEDPEEETEELRKRIETGPPLPPESGDSAGLRLRPARRVRASKRARNHREIRGRNRSKPAIPPCTLESRFREFTNTLPSSFRDQLTSSSEPQTRLVTALCAEAPGSPTAVAGDLLLRDMVDVLSRYGGRIESVHADQVLVLFGSPQMHEDDPERAVLAALELLGKAREHGLPATAGIATGHVRIGTGESEEPGQAPTPDLVVARAGRLRSHAEPGEILIGESTYLHLRHSFQVEPRILGAPGPDDGLAAYRILGRIPGHGKARGTERQPAEFVGRAEEYAALEEAFVRASGGAGQMVSIIGEAGVGKTRLVAELRMRTLAGSTKAEPPRWLEGHCMELATVAPYWPFVDMLGRHFRLAPQQSETTQAMLVTEELERLHGKGILTDERLEELAPLLGRLLSIRYGTEWDFRLAHAQPEQVKHQTCLAIRDLVLALAVEGPLVIVLEDLHWADTLSLDVISLLMESLTIAPFLLLCVWRPEADHGSRHLAAAASRTCPDRHREINLRELTPEQSRRLIDSLLSVDALSPDVRDTILAQAQGNPFFVEEVVRSLIDAGVIYRDGDRWRARAGASTPGVPETVQGVILSRVDRLESRLKEVLESASVIGRIFQRRILERAVEAEQATEEALAELEARALIYLDKPGPREEYSFRHVLTQQAIYQSILHHRRVELHERIAGIMEGLSKGSLDECCVELAHHYRQGGNPERAAEYLLMAGGKAAEAYMNEVALGHLRGVLELVSPEDTPRGGRRLRALAEMGKVHEVMGEHSLAESRFREAAELSRRLGVPARERAQVLYLLCKSLTARHRPQEYVPIARSALELVGVDSESPEALMLEFVLAYSSFDLEGDFTALCDYAERRGERIRALPYSLDNTINATYLAWAYLIAKNEPEALGWLEWAEAQARAHNDLVSLAAIQVRRGRDVLARCGDGDGAAEAVEKAAQIYRRIGARALEVRCHLCLGDIYYRFGRLEEAEACSGRAGKLCTDLQHDAHLAAEHELLRGQVALAQGDSENATVHFQAALAASPGRQWECFLRFLTGRSLLAQGRREEAARCLLDLLEGAREFRLPPAYFLTAGPAPILSLLEECRDGSEDFRAVCEHVRRNYLDVHASPVAWYLEPAQPMPSEVLLVREDFSTPLGAEWVWQNLSTGGGYRLENGLVVCAAIGRGLEGANLRAPRLMRPAVGDIVLQVSCEGTGRGKPTAGGLVVWKDPQNYLRLDLGTLACGHVAFSGCIHNRDIVVGRGRLGSEQVLLRIERSGTNVRALACAGGKQWFTVGQVEFPAEDPLRVGLFADGAIHPEVYLRPDREGSEIRFRRLELSRLCSRDAGTTRQRTGGIS